MWNLCICEYVSYRLGWSTKCGCGSGMNDLMRPEWNPVVDYCKVSHSWFRCNIMYFSLLPFRCEEPVLSFPSQTLPSIVSRLPSVSSVDSKSFHVPPVSPALEETYTSMFPVEPIEIQPTKELHYNLLKVLHWPPVEKQHAAAPEASNQVMDQMFSIPTNR